MRRIAMAKGQKKSNREIRKPKAEKPRKDKAAASSQKPVFADVFAPKK
jgi:hypothetical protein